MVKTLIAAALAAFAPLTPQANGSLLPHSSPWLSPHRGEWLPDARPALWVVNDHDTVIYLFGTFHALDGRSAWFNDEVMTAFTQSDELILETLGPEPVRGPPGSEQKAEPPQAGKPVAGSSSFLSTSRMVMRAGRARGMTTEKGADAILRRAAERSGKPVGSLESFEVQIATFAGMQTPAPDPGASPARKAQIDASLALILAELQERWNRGEVEGFAPLLEQMRVHSPDNYRILFLDRNSRWAAWIAQRLQQPGRVFVAVGAGHLAGRDSVQRQLAQVGIRSARIN